MIKPNSGGVGVWAESRCFSYTGGRRNIRTIAKAISAAGGLLRFSMDIGEAAGCDGLLLPGGGDMEPWRYGQTNSASRGLEPERDAAELDLLEHFTAEGKPVLGICRGLQTINVFFGGTLVQDLPGHNALTRDRLHAVDTAVGTFGRLWGNGRSSAVPTIRQWTGWGQGFSQSSGHLMALWRHCCIQNCRFGRSMASERLTGPMAIQGAADGGRLLEAFLGLCR